MDKATINILCKHFNIEKKIIDLVLANESELKEKFNQIDEIKEYNQYKVIIAMHPLC